MESILAENLCPELSAWIVWTGVRNGRAIAPTIKEVRIAAFDFDGERTRLLDWFDLLIIRFVLSFFCVVVVCQAVRD